MPHIHTEQVLHDINHWQDEKEQIYKQRQAALKVAAEDANKKHRAEHLKQAEQEKKLAKARAERIA